jgi:hypothetical protein
MLARKNDEPEHLPMGGEQMIDDEEATRKRRWRRNASIIIAAMMGILFVYGLIRFPDAPLNSCGYHSYCGKQGQSHTQKQFEDFEVWQNTLFWVWPIGLVALYILNRDRIRSRVRRPST